MRLLSFLCQNCMFFMAEPYVSHKKNIGLRGEKRKR